VTPLIVTEFVPAAIVPVSDPPRVPVPALRLRVTPVLAATLAGFPLASCACTTTEKAVPAVGLAPPFTEVIANLLAVNVTVAFCVIVTESVVSVAL